MKLNDIIETIKSTFQIENIWIFFIQITSFLLLCIATFYLIYKPVKKKIKERRDYIENNLKKINQNKLIIEKKLQEVEDKIVNTYNEANDIINDAKKKALEEYDDMLEKAKFDIEKEKNFMEEKVISEIKDKKEKMVNTILDICKDVLERNIENDDNKKYVDNLVESLIIDELKSNEKN